MRTVKEKVSRRGVIFFSLLLALQIYFQILNFLNDKEFEINQILIYISLILICKYYFKFESFLKARHWA